MNSGRVATPGRTRSCPHCKATILESAAVCPGCHHHLRFDPAAAAQRAEPQKIPLKVDGTIRHPVDAPACEYSVVVSVRNARGEEIAREVVDVGALNPLDERTFTLSVEQFAAPEIKEVPYDARRTPMPDPKIPGRPAAPPVRARPKTPAGPGTRSDERK